MSFEASASRSTAPGFVGRCPLHERDLDVTHRRQLRQVGDGLDGVVPGMPGGTLGRSQSHRRAPDQVDDATHLGASDAQDDIVADRVAIFQQCTGSGEEVLHEVLATERQRQPDEAGAGDGERHADAHQLERSERREREDQHGHESTDLFGHRVGALTLAGIGLAVVAEAIEANSP